LFAVVDIETTGGTARSHKIIEVAIATVEGDQIVDRYATLINPQRHIPPFITSLTGISNDMVAGAPTFEEVAETILSKTQGKVFVAHNVNFDYSFLKQEFNIIGVRFDRKKLCTVRLAKKIFPGFKSYSLGTLTSQLGIHINHRHRALGDAEATAEVLGLLIRNDQNDFIGYSLKRTSREATLPANLPKEIFESLPEKTGVYYFHDGKGKVVYVGKAKNIKNRIIGHFTGESGTGKRLFHENIHNISYELTGNELIALLLESREIKRLWPIYNRSQKFTSANHGLYQYADRNGYRRFIVSKIQPGTKAITNFRSFQEGRNFLNSWVKKFKLCAKLCGLQKSAGACFDHKLGICDGACQGDISAEYYNKRVGLALESLDEDKRTYAIVGAGREPHEKSLVLVENGIYLGHGFADYQVPARSFDELKDRISPFSDNHDIQKILNLHLKTPNGDEVIYF
jgi:DNA polymerase-3 subunit epsilon